MKQLFGIFSKRRNEDLPRTDEKKESFEAKSNSTESSREFSSKNGDLFGDDSDLGFC